jgi:glycosyltransferase involved in cell wall biosynthesis
MNKPDVSVVMSVFNSAPTLPATLDGVLTQEGVDLELIAIDDGSTDNSHQILLTYAARDPRLIVLHHDNRGLTCSLIRGCAFARGEFIARQDAGGDISLPGRFAHQLTFLRSRATVVMTACGTRVVDPEGEPIYEIRQNGHELNELLRVTSPGRIGGPSHHGAVMFRKSAYQRVGGYRLAFRVAQDFDLWTRLAEVGTCLATPEVFYQTRISCGSITHLNRKQQLRAAQAVLRCIEARREGRDEAEILENVKAMREPARGWRSEKVRDAELYYFIGRLLYTRDSKRAYTYLIRALSCWPIYPRAWLGLLRLLMATRPRSRRTSKV